MDPALQAVVCVALAFVWLRAAGHKLRDPHGFRVALEGYALLPGAAVPAAATGLVLAEGAVAIALLVPATSRAGAAATALLLGLYSAAIGASLLRGRGGIDCGCGGPTALRPLDGSLLARNAVLLAAALLAAGPASERSLGGVDAITVVFGAAVASLLFAASDLALAQSVRLRALRRQA